MSNSSPGSVQTRDLEKPSAFACYDGSFFSALFEPIGKRQKVEDVDDAAPPEENAVASVAEEQQTKQPGKLGVFVKKCSQRGPCQLYCN